jgi:deoxyribodipyrimidine photo-lyase
MGSERTAIMWFRRDLRIGDHPALTAAAAEGGRVLPVFVVDPVFDRAGAPRRAYLHDCLTSLDRSIRESGGRGLVVRNGNPAEAIGALASEAGASEVYVSRDYGPYGRERDAAVAAGLRESGRHLRGVGSPYAVPPGDVRKNDGTPYAVFTPFSQEWRRVGWEAAGDERSCAVTWSNQSVASDPLFARPDPGCALPPAGEGAALDRWREFLHDGLNRYDTHRDLPAEDGTSRLSPALRWGTVHPRQLLTDLDASGSGDRAHSVFSSELAWRDFYADVLFRRPESAWKNLNPKMDAMAVDTDRAARTRFDRWCQGQTGFGIVDAGMRQLAATGWMHNRVRMIVASFLVKDLHLPWQWGARWFMQHLVDGDLASNNHGWQWAAGTGTDAAPYFRVFNPSTQQERYDPAGEYVARWAPDRPDPMLDHAAERVEALRRLAALSR